MKKRWIYIIPVLLTIFLAVVHYEVVAKYQTRMNVTLPEVSVRLFSKTFALPKVAGAFTFDGTEKSPEITASSELGLSGAQNATNAGTYSIVFTLPDPANDTWSDGTSGPKTVTWTIGKRKIAKPVLIDGVRIFSGEAQSPEISDYETAFVSHVGTQGTNADHYEAVFTLNDTVNTMWTDDTTAAVRIPWGIYVCRIGTEYYCSVTSAFATNTSSDSFPVTMLCDWEENCVNADGEDAFTLDGFQVSSHGTTVQNQGTLCVSGPGMILSSCNDNASPTVFENTGTLTILSGVFKAEYSGESTGPNEAYGVLNNGGTTTINSGTFSVNSRGLAAEPLCANGGMIIVEGGDYSAINAAATHGAYGGWLEGGEIIVRDGRFYARNNLGLSGGFCGTSGHVSVEDCEVELYSTQGKNGRCIGALSALNAEIAGGRFTIHGEGGSTLLYVKGTSSVSVSSGTFLSTDRASDGIRSQGIISEGGTLTITGGTLTTASFGGVGATCISCVAGTVSFLGGQMTAQSSDNGLVYGIYQIGGDITLGGTSFICVSDFGHVVGLQCPTSAGTTQATGGSMTLAGNTVQLGSSVSNSRQLRLNPSGAVFPFTVKYGSYYQVGAYWSSTPQVSAEQVTDVSENLFLLESVNFQQYLNKGRREKGVVGTEESSSETRKGTFTVQGSEIAIGTPNYPQALIEHLRAGEWTVQKEIRGDSFGWVLSKAEENGQAPLSELLLERMEMELDLSESQLIIGAVKAFSGLTVGVPETPLYEVREMKSRQTLIAEGYVLPWDTVDSKGIINTYKNESQEVIRIEIFSKILSESEGESSPSLN